MKSPDYIDIVGKLISLIFAFRLVYWLFDPESLREWIKIILNLQ